MTWNDSTSWSCGSSRGQGCKDAGLHGGCSFNVNCVIMGHLASVDESCLPHTGAETASPSSPLHAFEV